MDEILEIFVERDPQQYQEFHQFLCVLTLILIEICSIGLYLLPECKTQLHIILVLIGCFIYMRYCTLVKVAADDLLQLFVIKKV